MAGNPFDQFDAPAAAARPKSTNPFDQFDGPQMAKAKAAPSGGSVPFADIQTTGKLAPAAPRAPAQRKPGFAAENFPSMDEMDAKLGGKTPNALQSVAQEFLHQGRDDLSMIGQGISKVFDAGAGVVNATGIRAPGNKKLTGAELGEFIGIGTMPLTGGAGGLPGKAAYIKNAPIPGSTIRAAREGVYWRGKPGVSLNDVAAKVSDVSNRVATKVPLTAATGAALAGKKLSPVVTKVTEAAKNAVKGPEARWIDKQAKDNPYAAFDAEVVADLKDLTTQRATVGTDGKLVSPKGRAPVDVKAINNLEATYQGRFKEMIDGFDIPPSEKLRYKLALDADHSGKLDQVNALRGTPQGDAVADAIIKTQRLRDMSKETPRGGWRVGARLATQAIGAAAPVLAAGPWGLAASGPGLMAARAANRMLLGGEASRVNMATKFIGKADRYSKLGKRVGPSGAIESKQALTEGYNAAADGAYAAKRADGATTEAFNEAFPTAGRKDPKVRVAADTGATSAVVQKLKATEPKQSAMDAFDKQMAAADKVDAKATDARTTAQAKGLLASIKGEVDEPYKPTIKQTLAKFKTDSGFDPAKVDGKLASFDQALDTPLPPPAVKVPKTKALNAVEQGIADNIAKGIPGNTGTQSYFAEHVLGGVDKADALRAAEAVAGDYPQFASEIAKFKGGYNTAKGFKQVVGPAMRKYLEQDGTLAKVQAASELANKTATARKAAETVRKAQAAKAPVATVPVDTAAQARLAGVGEAPPQGVLTPATQPSLPEVAPTLTEAPTGAPEAPQFAPDRGDLRGVSRPVQFNEAKARYIKDADTAIDKMKGDIRLPEDLMPNLDGVGERIRDYFKTTEDAMNYVETEVLPSVDHLLTDAEINTLVGHLRNIAESKPHATREALDLATLRRLRGRQKKN